MTISNDRVNINSRILKLYYWRLKLSNAIAGTNFRYISVVFRKTGLTIQVAAQLAYLQNRVSKICMNLSITSGMQSQIQSLIIGFAYMKEQTQFDSMAKTLYDSHILGKEATADTSKTGVINPASQTSSKWGKVDWKQRLRFETDTKVNSGIY